MSGEKFEVRARHWGSLLVCCALAAGCGDDDSSASDAGSAGAAANGGSAGEAQGGGNQSGTGSAGGGGSGAGGTGATAAGSGASGAGSGAGAGGMTTPNDNLPAAGNPDGKCEIPAEARAEDTSNPTRKVGTGTPASCTSDAFVSAVAQGGIITFDCGPAPVTIKLTQTAKVVNDKGPKIVIDGGNKVTLSGDDKVRILYQNTCDEKQKWTTAHCDDQDSPQLTVQNLTFVHGTAKGLKDPDGGGAIFVRGGRFKIVNSRFFNNTCDDFGPDVGGAAVRTFDQYQDKPVYVVNSTFGGRTDLGNVCSNGGGLSSIQVSYTVLNSLFSYNKAIGSGANPMRSGTKGGGSGGAIYNDGNDYTLTICGTRIENNTANEGGGAVFYVSNDDTGTLIFKDSVLKANPSKGFETAPYKGVFVKTDEPVQASGTTFE
ncbi:MAG TPA: hypothetical protein VFG30_15280 [Polyangiales bacterium]|nr:hypothetical protein [Polyangiales bacterium]